MAADQLLGMGGGTSSGYTQRFFQQQQQHPPSYGQSSSTSFPPQTTLGLAPYPYKETVSTASTHSNSSNNTNRSMGGPDGGDGSNFSRITSLEMLNTIAQMGSSTGSLENMGDASALKQQQLMYQSQQQQQQQMRMLHAFGGGGAGSGGSGGSGPAADPTPDVFPGLVRATSDNNGGSTLTFADSMGWPSFGNLNSLSGTGGGGSMDDLLSAGLLSRQVSGGSPFDLDGPSGSGSGSGDKYASSEGASLGYSLEDAHLSAAAVGALGGRAALGPTGTVTGTGAAASQMMRVKAPIVDMSAMRQQFSLGGPATTHHSSNNSSSSSGGGANRYERNRSDGDNSEGNNGRATNSVEQERLFEGNSVSG